MAALLAFDSAATSLAQTLTAQQQLAFDVYKELVEIDTVTATGDTGRAADAMAARLRADVNALGIRWLIKNHRERGGKLEPTYDFETPVDRPLAFKNETTYTGDTTVMTHQSTREWIHPPSAILSSLIDAGLSIKMLREHQILPWRALPMMVSASDGWWRLPHEHPRFPVSFSLRARKEQ